MSQVPSYKALQPRDTSNKSEDISVKDEIDQQVCTAARAKILPLLLTPLLACNFSFSPNSACMKLAGGHAARRSGEK